MFKIMKQVQAFILLMLGLASCLPEPTFNEPTAAPTFDYRTTHTFPIQIGVSDAKGKPITGVPMQLVARDEQGNEHVWFQGLTNRAGELIGSVELPTYLTSLLLKTQYVGLPNYLGVELDGNEINQQVAVSEAVESSQEPTPIAGKASWPGDARSSDQ